MIAYNQHELNLYDVAAEQLLRDDGFYDASLASLDLPEVQMAEDGDRLAVPYALHGDPDAPNVIVHPTPMFTRLDPHFNVRMAAQQRALGESYAVLGVQAYSPESSAFSSADRSEIASGSFSPIAARALRAVEAAGLDDGRSVHSYGFSLGGDVATQLAHDVHYNENRGSVNVVSLGAIEPARMANRGYRVLGDFQASGNDMRKNILASGIPALREAWGIGEGESEKSSIFDARAAMSVGAYALAGLRTNRAILKGFGTEASADQIKDLLDGSDMPIVLGRQLDSTVTPGEMVDSISREHGRDGFGVIVGEGDHSVDDDVKRSAGRIMLYAAHVDSQYSY